MSATAIAPSSLLQRALRRQVQHWLQAAETLQDRDKFMHAYGRAGLHRVLAERLETFLDRNCRETIRVGRSLVGRLEPSLDGAEIAGLQREVLALRELYIATEAAVHFYTDAVNTRTGPQMAAILRACDVLCQRSLDETLRPLGRPAPQVLTYVDRGLGASILRSDLRLWNGSLSPFAAVKVTFHNLVRPTAIVHETGHQFAHLLGWNRELAEILGTTPGVPEPVAKAYAGWASEIAADLFAFLHTGYGSVVALHDVVSGNPQQVFTFVTGDPHPTGYVRVLLAVAWCKRAFGYGPWDELRAAFLQQYDIRMVQAPTLALTAACAEHVDRMAQRCLEVPTRAFGGRPPTSLVDPMRVSPKALAELEQAAGESLRTSPVWLHREPLRTLALNSYLIATERDATAFYRLQERWMTALGTTVDLN